MRKILGGRGDGRKLSTKKFRGHSGGEAFPTNQPIGKGAKQARNLAGGLGRKNQQTSWGRLSDTRQKKLTEERRSGLGDGIKRLTVVSPEPTSCRQKGRPGGKRSGATALKQGATNGPQQSRRKESE